MKVLERAPGHEEVTTTIRCRSCKSLLEIASKDWQDEWYGNKGCHCPVCNTHIEHPVLRGMGDF